ncbi:NAD-dependent epimerase/dehydratase family protein [Parapedobacter sp. DT-150]|uniref:NAD-dependent epimerase/dehydratase family protein n=1 Tax=Parapedobacter sp. DT-150 TaxID=3396162 RepID=UPI003F1BE71C
MILVTGGTGFLGSILIRQLTAAGTPIRATKRKTSITPPELAGLPVQWVEADINDFFALEDAFDGVTNVYHCAGLISYHTADRKRLTAVNVQGTANVVTLALERRVRLLHVSSIAAVGRARADKEITESDLWEYSPDQPGYAIAKYEAEMEVWRGIAEGLDAVIVNPALIIGPTARTADSGASGTIFALLRDGLNFYTDGAVGLVDVEDVAKAMVLLMENPAIKAQRFLLSNVNMAHRELLERCSAYLGRPAPKFKATPLMLSFAWRAAKIASLFTGKRPLITRETAKAATQRMCFSNKKVVTATGMTFKPIDDTLREICTTVKNVIP